MFGAIRNNDFDLVKYFVRHFGKETMSMLLTTHETVFGDTCLTYAASLGRLDVVYLFLDEIRSIASTLNVSISDIIDRETSRGKVAIIEAIKHGRVHVALTLLSNAASLELPSRTHSKSALDWAVTQNDAAMLATINQYKHHSEHISSLFRAISNGDRDAVLPLIKGGTPYKAFSHSLTEKLASIRDEIKESKQQKVELQQQLSQARADLNAAIDERENRSKTIDDLRNERQDLVSSSRKDFVQAVAVVKLAATDSNIADWVSSQSQMNCELVAKALCTLFCIKVNEEESNSDDPFSQKMQSMLTDKTKLLHRIKHYQLFPPQAKLAASVRVKGIPGTAYDYLSVLDESNLCTFMKSIGRYLKNIFDQIESHEVERELLTKQRTEDDMLQRISTDAEVLKSRCGILNREIRVTTDSITKLEERLDRMERENVVANVMNTETLNGHTVLSWAAASGKVDTVKLLLKHGANTAIGEKYIHSCAIIIQVAFRHYRWKRDRTSGAEDLEHRERTRCMSLRIRSLSHFVHNHIQKIRLPHVEALFNGHAEVTSLLDKSDMSLFQAVNLFHLFHAPCAMIPRPLIAPTHRSESNFEDLLSVIILAGTKFHDSEVSLEDCPFVSSLNFASATIDALLQHRKDSLERKLSVRRDTLFRLHREKKITELLDAMRQSNFDGMIKASEEACISLDHEDVTGVTPLIRAVIVDSTLQNRYTRRPGGKKMSAVAYLLGRCSLFSPSVDYENRLGQTALIMGCLYGKVEVICDLIHGGADVNRQSMLDGNTPLHHACKAGNLDAVAQLLTCGANHALKNHANNTATDLAEERIVEFLNSWINKNSG